MSILALATLLFLSNSPSPTEIRDDLDAHPWRPTPAAPVKAESSPNAAPVKAPVPQTKEQGATTITGSWQVQLGALSTPDAASAEKKRLEKILGIGTVETLAEKGVYKLRYGRFPTKEAAEAARTAMKAKGLDGFAVQKP